MTTPRKGIDAAELRRIRAKYAEGEPFERIERVHHIHRRFLMELCADLERPVREKLSKNAPHVPWGLL